MPRWLRRLLSIIAGTAAVVVIAGGALLLLLQTVPAKRLLADRLEAELETATGFTAEVAAIDGFLPFSASVSGIRLSDERGPWLNADRLELDWRPAALLAGRLHVRRVVAHDVRLTHTPAVPERAEAPGLDLAIGLPRLPLPVIVDDVRIARLALDSEVLGTAAVLQAAGQAALGGSARDAALMLSVSRLDGVAGKASLHLAQSGFPAVLTLEADIDEPQGGLIARALSLPELPPVSLRLTGDGPATNWRGRLDAAAGPSRIDADVALAVDDSVELHLDGRMQDAGVLALRSTPYVPPSIDVAADLRWHPGRRLDVERLSLAAPDASAEMSGGLDVSNGRLQVSLDLAIADATRWRPLLAPTSIRSGRLAGTIGGTLDEPAFELQTTIDGLDAPKMTAERTEAKLRGRATLRDRSIVTAVSIDAEGRSTGMVVSIDPQLAGLLGDTADWSVDAELDLLTDDMKIDRARIAANGSTLEAAGSVGGYGRAIDAAVHADLADIAPVARLLDVPAAGRATLTASVSGDALAPRLTADIQGRFADFTVDDPTASVLLGRTPDFGGTITADAQDIDIGTFTINGAGASVAAAGRMAMDASSLQLNVTATIAEVAPVATSLGVEARGQVAGRFQLARTTEERRLRFSGTIESDRLVISEATSALLGPAVHASVDGSVGAGGVDLDAAQIEGSAARLTARGRIGDALAIEYRLQLPRLAALSPLVGIDLDGGLAIAGDVTGPLDSPAATGLLTGEALRIGGVALSSADGSMSARNLRSRPQGDVALDLVAEDQDLSLMASYQMRDDGGVALNDLRLAAPQTSLAGNLVVSPAGLIDGRVAGDIGDLAPLGSFFGETVTGSGTVALTFAPAAPGQSIDANLDLRKLSIRTGEGAPLSAEQVNLTADLRDAFGSPAGRADLSIGNAASGALQLAQATVTVDGDASGMRVRLGAVGEHGQPLTLNLHGEATLEGATQRLRLDHLDGSFGTLKARLNTPATLSREAGGIAIAGLDAEVGEGHLTGAGRLGSREVDVRLTFADLPLDLVAAFAPELDLGGTASADLSLAGDVAAPAAHADIRLADLRVGGTRIGETVGVDGTMTLDVRDGRGSLTAKLGGPPDFALNGQATVPLAFGLRPFAFKPADGGPIAGTVDGRIDLALVPRIVDLQGGTLAGTLDLDVTLDGTLAAPRILGEARIADGSYATAQFGTLVQDVAAVATADNDRIVLRSLSARDGSDGRLSASGSAALGVAEGGRYDGEVTLAQFAIPTGNGNTTVANGHVAGTLRFAGTDAKGRRRFAATADARDLAIDGRSVGVFGPHMQASLEGAFGDAGVLVETARIEGADGRFTADGRIAESVDLDYRLDLRRLAALAPLAGIDLSGSAEIAGRVTGPRRSPDVNAALSGRALRVAGVVFDSANGKVAARDLGGSPQGEVDLTVTAQGRQLSLATPFRMREDGALALRGLRVAGPQTSVVGDLVMLSAGLLEGRLRGDIGDLAILGPFIERQAAGAATLDLSFAPERRTQTVRADVQMRNLSLAGADGARLTAERMTLNADLRDALGTPSGRTELQIANAASGELSLSSATLIAEGGGKAMQVRLAAAGKHGEPFEVNAAGELALAPTEQRLRLERLDARFGSIDAKLNAPARLSRDARRISLADVDASIGKGRVTGSGSLGPREVALQLALADLPLSIFAAVAPQVAIDGTASADLRVAGTPSAPSARGEVRLQGLRSGGAKIGTGAALEGTATLELADGRGSIAARLGGPPEVSLDGRLSLPVAFRVQPFALDVASGAPLSGAIAGTVDLEIVPRIVDLHGDSLDGRLDLDMTIGGTRSDPRLIGTARIADGIYANAAAGTVLRNIEASLSGDPDRIRLQSLTATDGREGRLTASGSAILGGSGKARYDGEVTLQRFTILNRLDSVVAASGRLQLENADQGARLGGDVTIDSAELRIPEGLPPNIVKIDVIEINVPPGRSPMRAGPAQRRVALPLALAVAVNIPGRAFLRGRGLDSEWRGNMRVAGTLAAPDITGRLEVVRGTLNLLGKPLSVERGTVTFIGGDRIDPELDFTAIAAANDVNASIRVTGYVSAPRFDIGSDSGLPPEEALSRLLFGRSAGSLSPAEAVQLAQAASMLTGRGPGVLERLRSRTGLDVLTVGRGSGPNDSDASVRAGRYVGDRVFLNVEQGLTTNSGQVGVEVRVLPRITVEGGVGYEGSGRLGINWRYDY